MTLKTVIDKLLNSALLSHWSFSVGGRNKKPPGELILRLPEEERNLLKNATAKDFNHRIE